MSEQILDELVRMSNYLGEPSRGFAILGEGNTSARCSQDTFYVKASGTSLSTIDKDGFVKVSMTKVLSILDDPNAGDEEVTKVFQEALVEEGETRRPSVEAILHAILLRVPEYSYVGHTHPTHTNKLLCSNKAEEAAMGRIFPDQVVSMGAKSVFVPYVDPGLVLAREVRARFERFVEVEGVLPRAIMMQNHGLIVMGDSPKAVTSCTEMAEKTSEVIAGTYALGGPRFMTEREVERIYTRPDEAYRLKAIAGTR